GREVRGDRNTAAQELQVLNAAATEAAADGEGLHEAAATDAYAIGRQVAADADGIVLTAGPGNPRADNDVPTLRAGVTMAGSQAYGGVVTAAGEELERSPANGDVFLTTS